jgi:Ni/Co efflux regulator RcnB
MKKIIKITEDDLTKLIGRVINESDPKVGTGKKPKNSDRRLYTDENPKDTVKVKFRTKQDIIDTLSKDSFKSKSHARQSQIINLIHQRLRVALERAKDPEVKNRLRTAFEYIETRKEKSKKKKEEQSESKETNRKDLDFFDLVDKGIIFITEPFGNGKKQKSNWEGDSNIITLWNLKHPEKGQEWVFDAIKYPKLEAIQWWNDEGQFTLKDEKYNQILRSIKMYDNSSKQEQNESELTERCWKGYTQKGMKTMFGKRYPNCVKITK